MKPNHFSLFFLLLAFVAGPLAAQNQSAAPADPWPKTKTLGTTTYTIYQPQLESWDGTTLKGTAAVSVQAKGADAAVFGTLSLSASTYADKSSRMVQLQDLKITGAQFPSQPDQTQNYLAGFQAFVPSGVKTISLDRLEANLAIIGAKLQGSIQQVRNNPPNIIFSQVPALLVLVGGDPVFRPVDGTDLQRVINTRALLLKDSAGNFYLHVLDGFMTATSLNGPWTVAASVPDSVNKAMKAAVDAKQVDLLAGQPDPETGKLASLKNQTPPVIYVSTTPAELITLDGPPQWTPIPPTQLLFATNTISHVFKNMGDQNTYVLISGRWFKGPGFAGPWTYVPGNSLPQDFASIPDSSPKENAKASVPNTPQAKEAAIANSIPNTQAVNRKSTKMNPLPTYDGGKPELKPLEGTPFKYAVNCQTPVIYVADKNWLACQNGVWFAAASPNGPWTVATAVPAEIYAVPVSAPLHYVTYVRIYSFDANTVYVGFTPGYNGTVITPDGVVVYGTGYDYVPYVGTTVYVAAPVTYGYGTNAFWAPWTGWAFGFAAGWAWGSSYNYWCYGPPAPYWGPYWGGCYGAHYNAWGGVTAWGPYGWAGTSGNIYRQNGAWSSVSRAGGGYNAVTGNRWGTQYGHAYNSVTGTSVAGIRSGVENVYTGNYYKAGEGVAYNNKTGAAAAGQKVTAGNAYTGNSVTAGRGAVYNPNTGKVTTASGVKGNDGGVVDVNGNVVAGHDGDVYKKNDDGSWSQVNPPQPKANANAGAQGNLGAQNNAGQARQDFQNNNAGNAGQNRPAAGGDGSGNRFGGGGDGGERFGGGGGDGGGRFGGDGGGGDFSNFQNQLQSRDQGQQRFDAFQRSHPSYGGGGFGRGGGGGGRGGFRR